MTGSVSDRLNWLFDVVATQDPATGAWRSYTNAEAGSAEAVARLRAGAAADPSQLAELAGFFGVDQAFFGDDQAIVDQIRDDLLAGALRDCGLLSYVICRMSIPAATQREQLRHALFRERAATSAPRTWHDDRRFTEPGHDSGTGMTTTPMSVAQLDTLCRSLVDDLGLTPPFEPRELCERLAAHRDRRIKVRVTDLGATSGVGHLAPTRDVDQIFVERNSPAPQQALVIYHEVMHIVRAHLAIGDSFTCALKREGAVGGGSYADWREWEAEVGARALARLAEERPRPNRLPPAAGPAEHNIAAAFGFTHGHRADDPLG